MKRIFSAVLVVIFILGSLMPACYAIDKWGNLLQESARVFEEMTNMPDQGIPRDLLRDCHAIAIFPNTIQAGLGIGGKYGQGIIVAKNKKNGENRRFLRYTVEV